ncbi:hypothetical protein Q1695_015795 [Nippostrongylus brasiliensis]|nr:hypothetical protein Q1695_015795 [Nippostrongylus brasiliensis]
MNGMRHERNHSGKSERVDNRDEIGSLYRLGLPPDLPTSRSRAIASGVWELHPAHLSQKIIGSPMKRPAAREAF